MQITRQADYALRAVIFLARMEGDEKASTSAIAEKQKIPPSFLAKIVSQLSLAGLIQTSRGARGGVSLAKRPEEISVLDVIEAIDGPVMLNDCAGSPDNCPFGKTARCSTSGATHAGSWSTVSPAPPSPATTFINKQRAEHSQRN
jgi:Rrf2 family protein